MQDGAHYQLDRSEKTDRIYQEFGVLCLEDQETEKIPSGLTKVGATSLEATLAVVRCAFEKLTSFSAPTVGKEAPGMRKERGEK